MKTEEKDLGDFTYLFVLPLFSGGGAERVLLNLIRGLHGKGEPIRLVVFDGGGPLRTMVPDTLPVDELGTQSLRQSILPLISYIRKIRPKVIYSTLGYVNLALLVIAPLFPHHTHLWLREANLPSISQRNNRYTVLMWLGYRCLYRYADRLLVTSERMKREFIDTFRIPERIIYRMPNPVDEDCIRIHSKEIKRVPGAGFRFVAAGRLTHQKGFDCLLHWLAGSDYSDAHLTILGIGERATELKQLAVALGITQRVAFIGFVTSPWSWYAGADAFLLSSRWEGMPNAVLEALSCGTPVIATAQSGGISEIAKQASEGAVTVVESGEAFVKAMGCAKKRGENSIRSSLLPARYRIDSVVTTFQQWLVESS